MIDIRELCGDIDFFSGNVGFPDGFTHKLFVSYKCG